MIKGCRQYGFVLVELLVATLIISIIAGVLYTTFANGFFVWNKALKNQPNLDVDILVEKMTEDIRNSFPFRPEIMTGTQESVQFYSLVPSGNKIMTTTEESVHLPGKVHYYYDPGRQAIIRRHDGYHKILYEESAISPKVSQIVPKVQRFDIQYYHYDDNVNDYVWKDAWKLPCKPRALKLDIHYHPRVKPNRFTRVIPITNGVCGK